MKPPPSPCSLQGGGRGGEGEGGEEEGNEKGGNGKGEKGREGGRGGDSKFESRPSLSVAH